MAQIETSGNTQTENLSTHYIADILDEEYCSDMNLLTIFVSTGTGEFLTLNIPPKHIKRLQLFLQKEEMEEKYFQYITKNY